MKKIFSWKPAIVLLGIIVLSGLSAARAEAAWPERPITILVGFAPGGHMSISARALAQPLGALLGQPIIIKNKTGGTGTVAIASMLAAKPDGYTLCATPTSVLIRVSQMQKVPFKPFSSCRLVLGYAAPQLGVIVKSTAPWKTLADLVKDAKARPGGLKFATIGVGSTPQAAVDEIASAENLKLIHVPFKGSAEVIAAVLGGHVDFASMTSEFVPAVRSGQIRLLATMTEKRVAAFPDVPTLREQGYDFVNDTVFAIAAPAGTPPEVLSRLEGALARAVKSREYLEAIDKLDMIPIQYGSGEMDAFQKKQWKIINRHLVGSGVIKEAATPPE